MADCVRWGIYANPACVDGVTVQYGNTREISLQGKIETFQGHKTLKMGTLDRLLNFFYFSGGNDSGTANIYFLLGYNR